MELLRKSWGNIQTEGLQYSWSDDHGIADLLRKKGYRCEYTDFWNKKML